MIRRSRRTSRGQPYPVPGPVMTVGNRKDTFVSQLSGDHYPGSRKTLHDHPFRFSEYPQADPEKDALPADLIKTRLAHGFVVHQQKGNDYTLIMRDMALVRNMGPASWIDFEISVPPHADPIIAQRGER
jgi:hypothetical protein